MGYFHARNRHFDAFLLYNLLNNSEFSVAWAVIHHVILISCGVLLVVIGGSFNIIQVTNIDAQPAALLEGLRSVHSTTGLFMATLTLAPEGVLPFPGPQKYLNACMNTHLQTRTHTHIIHIYTTYIYAHIHLNIHI